MSRDYEALIEDLSFNIDEDIDVDMNILENIDGYISQGIKNAKKIKRRKKRKLIAAFSAAVFCIAFVSLIRISPAFAKAISNIPGFYNIVFFIQSDMGLADAIKNDLVQPINQTIEHDEVAITLREMIIDEKEGMLVYTIENKGSHRFIKLYDIRLMDNKGKEIKIDTAFPSNTGEDFQIYKRINRSLKFSFPDGTEIPENFTINIELKETENESLGPFIKLPYKWSFDINIDKNKFDNKIKNYDINQGVEIEGQKITFTSISITPMKSELYFEYNPNNTKKILSLNDIVISDEEGNIRKSTSFIGMPTEIGDNRYVMYFESSYFFESKELYIKGSELNAVDKEKELIVFDIDKKKIIQAPDDRLQLLGISSDLDKVEITFKLVGITKADMSGEYIPFMGVWQDNKGRDLNLLVRDGGGINIRDRNVIEISDNIEYPISFKLINYPQRIKEEFKVKVK